MAAEIAAGRRLRARRVLASMRPRRMAAEIKFDLLVTEVTLELQ